MLSDMQSAYQHEHHTRRTAEQVAECLAEIARMFEGKRFVPHKILNSGHAQTLAAYAWPRLYRFHPPRAEQRLFEVEPGVRLLAHCHWHISRDQNPTILLIHGMEGSSTSVYMLATADKAFRAGFNVVRLNLRNCGGTEHLTPTLYHAGMSADLRAVIDELTGCDQLTKLFLIGYSLGGNMALKLAAEYGEEAPAEVIGVCAVSPSVNLKESSELISRRSNWIYHSDFVRRLRRRIRLKQKLFPNAYSVEKVSQVRTIRDFDEYFTAPAHGFVNADDYYQKTSSIHVIDRIRIPTLIIHAHDDPFIPFSPLRDPALAANPYVLLIDTDRGGHVAFIAARTSGDEDRFWAENRAVEFCKLILEPGSHEPAASTKQTPGTNSP